MILASAEKLVRDLYTKWPFKQQSLEALVVSRSTISDGGNSQTGKKKSAKRRNYYLNMHTKMFIIIYAAAFCYHFIDDMLFHVRVHSRLWKMHETSARGKMQNEFLSLSRMAELSNT